MATTPAAGGYRFDDRNIRWHKLGDLEHFLFSILDIDEPRGIVDFVAKLEPHKPIMLHEHIAHTNTMVVQGEHRLYEPDGRLKEIRPAGSYTSTKPGAAPHREAGGDEGAVVFYSVRGDGGVYFTLIDEAGKVAGTLSFPDFIAAYAEQRKAA